MKMKANDDRLLSIKEVLEMVGVSKSTLYKMIAEDRFPRPVRIRLRGARWWQSEITEWVNSRPRATEENWH